MEDNLWLKELVQSVSANKKKKGMQDGIVGLVGLIVLGGILVRVLTKSPTNEGMQNFRMYYIIFFIVCLAVAVKRGVAIYKMDPRESIMKEILKQFPNATESKQFLDAMNELEHNVIETKEADIICNSKYIVEVSKKVGYIGTMKIYNINEYKKIKVVEYGTGNAMNKNWKLELELKEGKKKEKIRLLEPYEADMAEKVARKYYPYLYVE